MIKAGQIAKGMFIRYNDTPFFVADREFVNPGKGAAFVRTKLKNARTGQVIRQVIKTQESVEDIDVETRSVQYLYTDGTSFIFMDNETFDQIAVPVEGHGERGYYLKEGDAYQLLMWEDEVLDIVVPLKMALRVADAEIAEKGDTATGATKGATTETGLRVKVPLFIKEGDSIVVNTESGEYVERAG